MPALTNRRHEAFAQALSTGMSATAAYRVTYGSNSKNCDVLGPRLSLLGKVGKRVKELQEASERVTHLTMAEKRSIYAAEATNKRNKLKDRLRAMRDDSELAGHIKAAETGGVHVNVNMVMLTEDRRKELMAKKRAAMERKFEQAAALRIEG